MTDECGSSPDKAIADRALRLHARYRGKIQTIPKVPLRALSDFAIWYTPGVAAASRAVHADPDEVYRQTNKANTIAIVTDGSRVLGLGDIGPEAALPVMEGKALLFKHLGGVDAVPICLDLNAPEKIVATVKALAPAFGAINLEDISQPKCFQVLDRLRESLSIPVWHDDQQGTATVVLAGLRNALKVVNKRLDQVRIALIGAGAANIAVFRLLTAAGADPARMVVCDSQGILHRERDDIAATRESYADKWRICRTTNAEGRTGGGEEALRDADVCIAFSRPGPGVIEPRWIAGMAADPVVFACANPTPEVWPWQAAEAGAGIVATGRSDLPNQVNNALAFPGIFRGILDVRTRAIDEGAAMAAADALAELGERRGLGRESILPSIDDPAIAVELAVAVGRHAMEMGEAARPCDTAELRAGAERRIAAARAATDALIGAGLIAGLDDAP
ncbi:NAD(P)-dependent malic enzyme [Ferruginivarius sediminum]|uniref:NADP-dependent malic enzyme n=1 Tax=Ferruginivarius sediminum TaxID=2661937 RepID=A0A369T6U3_9PROT|nr:NADP-dependent malic enzyme [Ferruginivarius sediminum]RDD61040.1 NADP-dependent malic enzyme [Ferruginivarius sediminum]